MGNSKFKNTELADAGQISDNGRRSFLKKVTAASVTLANTNLLSLALEDSVSDSPPESATPWFRRITRWGQINITENNAGNMDIAWWRKYWKRTETQGIILNAGGIVAYYPTKVPHHRRALFLGDNDLFGDMSRAAHEDGLVVFARMDSGRANDEFYNAHPDWFCMDASGNPFKTDKLNMACVNGPYFREHIPAILSEIATAYKPEGFTDNMWHGLGRNSICYCENCKKSFRDKTGKEIPRVKNWEDPVYRDWIEWNYKLRLEIWDLYNLTSKSAGGPNCTWSGMNSGTVISSGSFRDLKGICDRADIIMLDHQSRSDSAGFQQNAEAGKYIHSLAGWDKIAPESMAMYGPRISSKPAAEAQMWMLEGIAGGIAPWWHHVSGYHEDRRMYHTAEPVLKWQKANEEFLYNRTPVATVGVVWSQENTDFFGRDDTSTKVELPWRGIVQTLVRARIPYIPVHADHIDREAGNLSLLILPNFGLMTDEQVASVRRFVKKGGGLIATGESSLYTKFGDPRPDYALGDLFGAHLLKQGKQVSSSAPTRAAFRSLNTYLRLAPELRRNVDGPHINSEPMVTGERHPVLTGFEETDIIPYGGVLEALRTDPGSQVLATFVPESPTMPPEDAWMRIPKTDVQGLIINITADGSRVTFIPADIDRQYASGNHPDHGNLLANIIRWTSKDNIPLLVEGAGMVDCNIYKQPGRIILHICNLISAGTWRQPIDEFIPIGPISVRIKLTEGVQGKNLNFLVSGQKTSAIVMNGWSQFKINSILNHEVIVIT
jgi:hypothetical protein